MPNLIPGEGKQIKTENCSPPHGSKNEVRAAKDAGFEAMKEGSKRDLGVLLKNEVHVLEDIDSNINLERRDGNQE